MSVDAGVIFCTFSSQAEAQTIVTGLLEKKLIACANMIHGVESRYWWNDVIQSETEVLAIMKTQKIYFEAVEQYIHAEHSYDVPEIIMLPIDCGSEPYLAWVKNSTENAHA